MILPLLVLGPVAGALAAWHAGGSPRRLRAVALSVLVLELVLAAMVVAGTASGQRWVHGFGGWGSPHGIVFAADRLSATFLALTSLLLTASVLHVLSRPFPVASRIVPLLFMLAAGLQGAFLTADLFNLFVMFELVLVASYLLLQAPGSRLSVHRAFPVVAMNLAASFLFFVGVGVLYAALGSVSLAEMAAQVQDADPVLVGVGGGLLVVAFATKAALVPFVAWLPMGYSVLDGAVAAFFAGLMTKLGVYALLRTVPLLFGDTWIPSALVALGAVSAVVGVVLALGQYDLRRLLGFHIVSQVGYMVLGLGLSTALGLAGAIFYLIHHVLVKSALFLFSDQIETGAGTLDLRALAKTSRRTRTALVLGFLVPGLSLAGMPPLSGFVAKVGLFRATLDEELWVLVAVLIVASFGTLASMLKVWKHLFAETALDGNDTSPKVGLRPAPALVLLVAASILVALFAGPLWSHAVATADQLRDVEGYVGAIREAGGRGREQFLGGVR